MSVSYQKILERSGVCLFIHTSGNHNNDVIKHDVQYATVPVRRCTVRREHTECAAATQDSVVQSCRFTACRSKESSLEK